MGKGIEKKQIVMCEANHCRIVLSLSLVCDQYRTTSSSHNFEISLARPSRKLRRSPFPVESLLTAILQSHPLFAPSTPSVPLATFSMIFGTGTLTKKPLLPALPLVVAAPPKLDDSDPSMQLPTREKLLLEVMLLIVLRRRSRGGGGCWPPWAAARVERKHSSHWAQTRGFTVSKSSIALTRAKHCEMERMLSCSVSFFVNGLVKLEYLPFPKGKESRKSGDEVAYD